MLDTPLTIDFDGSPVTLDRINQDNYGAVYFGRNLQKEYTIEVKHTIPPRGGTGESHVVKLSVAHYDSDGAYIKTSSAWIVIKTFDGNQDSSAEATMSSLTGFLGQADVATKITSRQS